MANEGSISLGHVRDIKAESVRVNHTFKLPTVFLTLNPPTPFPTKGLMVFNTNPALQTEPTCSDIWYANGTTWQQLELCLQPQTPQPQ